MTDAEYQMWSLLRRHQLHGLRFRRQHPIGPFTLDFYCPALRLAVEVDGGQHAEARKQGDADRTDWLARKGILVIRYWNNDVLSNSQGVLSALLTQAKSRVRELTPSPTLPLSWGGRAIVVAAPPKTRDLP
jgi:very-short-patch-repair endonuclease